MGDSGDLTAEEQENRVLVSVRTVDGQCTRVSLLPSQTVAHVKELVTSKFKWPTSSPLLHLFLRGSKLNVAATVKSLELRDGEFLVMIPYAKKSQGKARLLFNQTTGGEYSRLSAAKPAHLDAAEVTDKPRHEDSLHSSDERFGPEVRDDYQPGERSDKDGAHGVKAASGVVEHNRAVNGIDSQQGSNVARHTGGLEPCPGSRIQSLKETRASSGNAALLPESSTVSAAETVWEAIVADLGNLHDQQTVPELGNGKPPSNTTSSPANSDLRGGIREENLLPAGDDHGEQHQSAPDEPIRKRRKLLSGNLLHVGMPVASETRNSSSYDEELASRRTQAPAEKKKRKAYSRAIFDAPMPDLLEHLNSVFTALNTVCAFLQKQHMQPTWRNVKEAIQPLSILKDEAVVPSDVHNLASLCPRLVIISNLSGEGDAASFNIDLLDPNKLKQHEELHHTKAILATDFEQIGPEDVMPSAGGGKQISERVTNAVIKRRQKAFQAAIIQLLNILQTDEKFTLEKVTLDGLLDAAGKVSANIDTECAKQSALPRPPRHHKQLIRCTDVKQLSAVEMLEHLKQGAGALGQVVHCQHLSPRIASYGSLNIRLSDSVAAAVKRYGITRFYSHQAQAINIATSRSSVIISTSTASGKSLCYNVPTLEELVANPHSCALYLFPTKALAQDQLRALQEMTEGMVPVIHMGVYDGDTHQDQRLKLRDCARLLITNPDMLHVGLLPSHEQFHRFLSNLRYVVVDEAHAYRGAFGCHTAMILRRLRRLCHHSYGAELTFIICSATVANPREHAMELVGLRDIHVVENDGSPCGEKLFAFWNPPIVFTPPPRSVARRNNQNRGRGEATPQMRRASPIVEVATLLAEMVQHGLRCIAFCKTRKLCELVHNYTREILKETAPDLISTIRAYRSGYTAEDRRAIESDLFGGKLRAVAATNALELGVDVGSLDATLHLGFPGTVASLWQQSGRAGRREKPSLSIYVAFGGPLDQHFMKNPMKLFSRPLENAQVDAQNHQVLEQQVSCAAAEFPLHVAYDEEYFGSGLQAIILKLMKQGLIGRQPQNGPTDESWRYIGAVKSPSQAVSIRAIDPEKYSVINEATNKVIEEVEANKAFFEVYEGAVYMHQGKTFLVKVLDLAAKVAICREADVKYYTKTRDFTDVHVMGGELAYPTKVKDSNYPSTTAQASLCKVTTRWIGFRRIWQGSSQTFDSVQLFLPDVCYESQAAWIRVPHKVRWDLDAVKLSFREGLHAASHALLNVLPLYIMCNPSDLGTECANPHDTRYYPERLLVYDRHPGGIGIAAQARPMFAELLQAASELLASCECVSDHGCPNCVQVLDCSEYNEVINKKAAIMILEGVIKAENDYREGKQESSAIGSGICRS